MFENKNTLTHLANQIYVCFNEVNKSAIGDLN